MPDAWTHDPVGDSAGVTLGQVHVSDDQTVHQPGGRLRPDERFPIASVSKALTALLLARLALDDDLEWSGPVWPSSRITWRELLTHTGGLPLELRPEHWFSAGVSREELRRASVDQPTLGLPPFTWHYSNLAYGLAALRVEQVTGVAFPLLLDQRLLQPLGMTATSFSDGLAEPPGVLGAAAAAGDLRSTLSDLARLAGALAGHRPDVVSWEMIRLLLEGGVADGAGGVLGAGVRTHRVGAHVTLMSSGTILGHTTCVVAWPRRGASVLVAPASVDHGTLRDAAVDRWRRHDTARSWWWDGQEVVELRCGDRVELLIPETAWPFPLFAGRAAGATMSGVDWRGDRLDLTDRGSALVGPGMVLTATADASAFGTGVDGD